MNLLLLFLLMIHENRSTEGSTANLLHYLIPVHSRFHRSNPTKLLRNPSGDSIRRFKKKCSSETNLCILQNKSTPLLSMPARDALLHGSANKISSSSSSHIESEKYNFHFSALTSSTDTERGEITKKSIQTSNRVRFEITRRN